MLENDKKTKQKLPKGECSMGILRQVRSGMIGCWIHVRICHKYEKIMVLPLDRVEELVEIDSIT